MRGNRQAAIRKITVPASVREPSSVEEALEQASLNKGDGNADAAEALYRFILKEDPQNAEAQKALHNLRKSSKKKSAQKKSQRRKRKSRPASNARFILPARQPDQEDVDAVIALYTSGRLDKAKAKALQLIKKYPRTPVLFNVLSATLVGQGKLDDAIVSLRRALKIKPDYAEAHNNMGCVLNSLGKSEEAVESCRQALKINPDYADAHNNLGIALYSLGKPVEAIASYERALKIKPDFFAVLKNLGSLYERTNKLEKAEECIQKAIHFSPNDPDINLTWAVILKRQGKIQEAIQTLKLFTAGDIPEKILATIHNELGKLYDREKNTEKAFHHFSTANGLQARNELSASFKKEAFLFEVEQSERILTSGGVRSWGELVEDQDSGNPTFLLGFPRSGTTLLDQILDSHPGIQVMEEKPVLYDIKLKIAKEFDEFPTAIAELDAADVEYLQDCYFQGVEQHITRDLDAQFVDKFPLNISYVPLILRLFPSARIILALRHPCDVVLSNFMQQYRLNDAMANFFTLADAAHCYAQVMGLWQKCAAALPMNCHTVKYESLVTDFENEVRSLVQFLGLDWDDTMLDFSDHARKKEIINTPSYQTVTEPINQRAKFRWKRYQDHLEPVLDELSPYIETFGYSELGSEKTT